MGADIPNVWTAPGWHYPDVFIVLYSRPVVDWATSDRQKNRLAVEVLRHAILIRSSQRSRQSVLLS